jgi:hypothetical protein
MTYIAYLYRLSQSGSRSVTLSDAQPEPQAQQSQADDSETAQTSERHILEALGLMLLVLSVNIAIWELGQWLIQRVFS